jgi:hypothetical protein
MAFVVWSGPASYCVKMVIIEAAGINRHGEGDEPSASKG